jgi:hypothetical protein
MLAVFHWVWSLVLLLIAAWLAAAAIRVLPYLSTGTPWTNLPRVLLLAVLLACLPGSLGAWMALLGRWTWRGHPNLRAMLLATHGSLLLLGMGATAVGLLTLRAAERSAARGGGLMGPLGAIPLAAGLCVSAVAAVSIAVALLGSPLPDRRGPG